MFLQGEYKIEAKSPNSAFFVRWYQAGMMPPFRLYRFFSRVSNVFVKTLSRSLILVLLIIGGVHPNPGPTPPLPPKRLVSWNCNGISNSTAEFNQFLSSNNVAIACIQETKLGTNSRPPKFPGYATIRQDRAGGGGGASSPSSNTRSNSLNNRLQSTTA